MPLSIEELKARLAATKIKGRPGNFLRLETDKPVVVHILPGNDSLWFRQIGTHWLGKNKVNCANPDGEGAPCYVCDRIKEQRDELAAARKEHEGDSPEDAAENAPIFNAMEEAIRRISARRAFAFNVLIKGEETPKVFEAPWMIFNTIYTMFNSAVNDYEIDITDPHESTPFTLLRTGSGKNGTRYTATAAPRGRTLFTGAEAKEKIAEVLSKMANLDEQYKLPEKTELVAAWNTFTSGGEGIETARPEPATRPATTVPASHPVPPKAPPSMSRIGGKPVSPAKAAAPAPPSEPEVEPENEQSVEILNGNGNGEEGQLPEEPAPAHLPTKQQANLASSKILGRLKGKK